MTPLARYDVELQQPGMQTDAAQLAAAQALQRVYDDLLVVEPAPRRKFGKRVRPSSVQGLYLWGGVGRGKTWLMDLFYESLPFEQKMRSHFHRFMWHVHDRLRQLDGERDPLKTVAAGLARRARVICFDEFFVSDITDAMILGTLFEELFKRGVTLVATSNVVPDELYKDGLQRARFLPTIALLNEHTQVLNVDGGQDYRLRALEQAEIYHSPLDAAAEQNLAASFAAIAPDRGHDHTSIDINNRCIEVVKVADGVVWLDFQQACDGPRSQNDYIEMARRFHTVLLADLPALDGELENQARRFIALVDEFYDRNVKLIISAATPIDALYQGERLRFEFERTQSRLLEMQSHGYLARAHLP